jgi:hypothetical protein
MFTYMPKCSLATFSVIAPPCGCSYLFIQFRTISMLGTYSFRVFNVILDKPFNESVYFRCLQKFSKFSTLCLGIDLARCYCRVFLLYLGCIYEAISNSARRSVSERCGRNQPWSTLNHCRDHVLVGTKDNHMPLDQHSPCNNRSSNVAPLAFKVQKLRLSFSTCVPSDK